MILKITAIAFVSVFITLLLKDTNKEFSFLIMVVSGVIVLLVIFKDYAQVIEKIVATASKNGVPGSYIKLILKVIGVSYLCEFSSSAAYDAGAKAIASYIEFSCRIFIVLISMPLFTDLIHMITGLL